jgi:sulfur-oxidizing protein SoxX
MSFPDYILAVFLLLVSAGVAAEGTPLPADYCQWQAEGDAITEALCGLSGDAARGRLIAMDSHGGNCLACHRMPIPEESLHGTVGPPLDGVATRLSAGQLRLRIVDERRLNPATIMPGFYRDPRLSNRVASAFRGKTFMTAQQVEDVVAYLETLQ